jgi:hypothetical protein
VDEGRIAWFARRNGNYGIYLWDSLTGITSQLGSSVNFYESEIALVGDLVVWCGIEGEEDRVVAYNLATAERRILPGVAATPSWVSTDGRYVLWNQGDPDGGIYLYDWISGQRTRLTDNNTSYYPGGVDNGLALHYGTSEESFGQYRFVLHDPVKGEEKVVTAQTPLVAQVTISDGRFAWVQSTGAGGFDVFVHDMSEGVTTQVTDQPSFKHSVDLKDDVLVWADGEADFSEVFMARLPGAVPVQVTSDPFSSMFSVTDGGLVTWVEERPIGAVIWTLPAAASEPVAVTDTFWGTPDVSGGRIAWDAGEIDIGGITAATSVMSSVFPLFADVPLDHPYFLEIQGLAERDIISGYVRGDFTSEFRPENPVWRAQFAKMIAGALSLEVVEALSSPFTDLGPDRPDDLYPHEYVAAVAAAEITKGTTSTTFTPYKDISRAQVVTMAYRAAKKLAPGALESPPAGYTGTLGNFSSDHAEAMRVLEYSGLLAGVRGFGPGWDPWAPAPRGEVAAILWALMRTRALAGQEAPRELEKSLKESLRKAEQASARAADPSAAESRAARPGFGRH